MKLNYRIHNITAEDTLLNKKDYNLISRFDLLNKVFIYEDDCCNDLVDIRLRSDIVKMIKQPSLFKKLSITSNKLMFI